MKRFLPPVLAVAACAAVLAVLAAVHRTALPFLSEADSAAPPPAGEALDGSQAALNRIAPIRLADMAGRDVVLEGPAARIVAVTASDCEILYALGAGAALVGRGAYCDYPAEALALPVVESGAQLNIEQVLALRPRLVLMNTMAQNREQLAQLEEAGIAVAVSDAKDLAGVYQSIRLIGGLCGRSRQAGELVARMESAFGALRKNIAEGHSGGSVYFEVSPLEHGLWTAGRGTFMDEIAGLLGLENIFGDVEGWAPVSAEQVLARNPDHIVTIAMRLGEGPDPADEIRARPGWAPVAAVRNGSILLASHDQFARPGPRLAEAAETLAAFFRGAPRPPAPE